MKITIEVTLVNVNRLPEFIESNLLYRLQANYAPFRDLKSYLRNASGATECTVTKVEVK
jgi:hypothetical protein